LPNDVSGRTPGAKDGPDGVCGKAGNDEQVVCDLGNVACHGCAERPDELGSIARVDEKSSDANTHHVKR